MIFAPDGMNSYIKVSIEQQRVTGMAKTPTLGARIKARWPLMLFASVFFFVGLGFLVFGIVPTIVEAQQMRNWTEGKADLLEAELITHYGDDSTTYSVEASYIYRYEGVSYTNDRVAINSGSDNVGDFQQQLGRQLERALRDNRPVPVWINPDQPQQAVLNRELRWSMLIFYLIFVLAFGGSGGGLLAYCVLSNNGLQASPITGDKPWLANSDWQTSTIFSHGKATMIAACAGAILWNVIAIPAAVIGMDEAFDGNWLALLVLIFPAVGLGIAIFAVRSILSWRRFGRTPLVMDPFPGAIGGHVGGAITIPVAFDPSYVFKATLSCIFSEERGSGDDRRRHEKTVWQTEGAAHTEATHNGTRAKILFEVEPGLPNADAQRGSRYHYWKLTITAALPGIDYNRSFDIPVYAGNTQASDTVPLSNQHPEAIEAVTDKVEYALNLERVPGGVLLHYPAFRHPWVKLSCILIGGVFSGIGIGLIVSGESFFIGTCFSLFGLPFVLGFLYSLLLALDIRLDQDALYTRKRLLGVVVGKRKIPRNLLSHLEIKEDYTMSSGSKSTTYYKIQAHTVHGKKIDVGLNLAGRNTAQQALDAISSLTGVAVR